MPWQTMKRINPDPLTEEDLREIQEALPPEVSEEARKQIMQRAKGEDTSGHYANDVYHAIVRRQESNRGGPDLLHISVKRHDRGAARDWRDMQRIKNDIAGEDREGVELYPSEKRVVDTANQFHIWVIDDPEFTFPFGFQEGLRLDNVEGGPARQRNHQ